ncbi:hypothetical protein QN219_26545 [Sinorhizobium sp. 7-81]|nr:MULTISPECIES: hypothetical protein [unclassified Sinorhizobium]MDK1389284.1 hypothetical protein [Sinorhizobium sp. 7-81]MDK1493563.1 hypothetical protein [Sinorhizobium sp. 8-89]
MFGVKSPSQVIERQPSFLRKHMDMIVEQVRQSEALTCRCC